MPLSIISIIIPMCKLYNNNRVFEIRAPDDLVALTPNLSSLTTNERHLESALDFLITMGHVKLIYSKTDTWTPLPPSSLPSNSPPPSPLAPPASPPPSLTTSCPPPLRPPVLSPLSTTSTPFLPQ